MDWKRYASSFQAATSSSGGEEDGRGGGEDELSALQRTRLELSRTWYAMLENPGLKRLKDIISGVGHLPPSLEPLYLLGETYVGPARPEGDGADPADAVPLSENAALLEDLASRVLVTYRSDFAALGESGITTDVGWGCTIRSGQMLMANLLVTHALGRNWRRPAPDAVLPSEPAAGSSHASASGVVSLFLDAPGPAHPFSLHGILNHGSKFGIRV